MTTALEDNRYNGTHKRTRGVTKCYTGLGLGFFGIDSKTFIEA
jgi:hypothetical protein